MTLRHLEARAAPAADQPGRHRLGRSARLRYLLSELPNTLIGDCWAASPRVATLILLAVLGLLVVIALTLSPGNALLVVVAGVIMRLSCERRQTPPPAQD